MSSLKVVSIQIEKWKDKAFMHVTNTVWILLLTNLCFGQTITYLDADKGLSNSNVTGILKDKHGFMWFATLNGLNRYDGYNFLKFRTRFNDSLSLPDNQINTIAEDEDGKIWVGTRRNAGVMDSRTLLFSRIQFFDEYNRKLSGNRIVNAIYTFKGKTYLGTSDLGLFQCDHGSVKAKLVKLEKHDFEKGDLSVNDIISGDDGKLYVATSQKGIAVYNPVNNRFTSFLPRLLNGNCIGLIRKNKFWVGTSSGLLEFDPTSKIAARIDIGDLNSSRIMDLTADEKGFIWISTDGEGLFRVDPDSKKKVHVYKQEQHRSISSDHLYCVYIDEEQRKWIGTMRGGLNIIDSRKNPFTAVRQQENNSQSLASNVVFSFCEDGQNVWIGTDGKGISIWDRSNNVYRNIRLSEMPGLGIEADHIPTIVSEKPGTILIGTYGAGVIRYTKKENRFERVKFRGVAEDPFVWTLYKASDGVIWAGCIAGKTSYIDGTKGWLYRYDDKSDSFVDAGFPVSDQVITIADDDHGNLWVGTFNQAIRINKTNQQIKRIHLDAEVRAIYFSKNGGVWIGTQGNGLILYNPPNGSSKTFTEKEGLSSNTILRMEEDKEGFIWASTLSGLTRFKDSNSPSFQNFYASDGLLSNQFYFNASLNLTSGELFFGGLNGFTVVEPDSVEVYNKFPEILLTGMRVLNSDVGLINEYIEPSEDPYKFDKIVLPFDKAMFSIDVVAPEYSFASTIKYSYFLRGWDKDWNYLNGNRSISYSRLIDGNYTLEIRTTNPSGEWNNNTRKVHIIILPPWYRSWWAYLLYITLAGFSVFGYILYQKKKARMKYEIEIAKMKASQEAELNEKKISFFINIAHELRTPLTLIVNPIKDLLKNEGKNFNVVDISSVHRNATRLLSLVDQLLLFKSTDNEVSPLRFETINLNEVCNEVFLCFINQVKSKGIDYRFEADVQNLLAYTDREKVEIVLFNLLSNAIKYTGNNGKVSICLSVSGDVVEIKVKDSGTGIPASVGEKLFDKFYRVDNNPQKKSGFGIGLFISHRIAAMQQGSLTYSSTPGEGTEFIYRFPVGVVPEQTEQILQTPSQLLEELSFEQSEPPTNIGKIAESGEQVENILHNKATVLVIDDDGELRAYIRQILEDYSVVEATNAEEGFAILNTTKPNIIISDIVMPGTSGLELCARIKESPDFGHIPVILLTGTSSADIKLKGIECGADDYITKPFQKDLLLARIKGILKGRDSLRQYFFNEVTLQHNNERISDEYRSFLQKCIDVIEENVKEPDFNVSKFTKLMGMSHSNLYRKVKAMSGLSISEFIRYLRLKRAAELLITTDSRINEVAYSIGFENIQYFREQFTRLFKVTPSEYIKRFRKTLTGTNTNNKKN